MSILKRFNDWLRGFRKMEHIYIPDHEIDILSYKKYEEIQYRADGSMSQPIRIYIGNKGGNMGSLFVDMINGLNRNLYDLKRDIEI